MSILAYFLSASQGRKMAFGYPHINHVQVTKVLSFLGLIDPVGIIRLRWYSQNFNESIFEAPLIRCLGRFGPPRGEHISNLQQLEAKYFELGIKIG